MTLIDIKKYDFEIDIDLRYAKKNNITGKRIFIEEKCLLIKEAAEKLFLASRIAKNFDCKLKVFDAYRPKYVQEALWSFCPNADFLTDPARGSPHTRGVAVDLTLIKNAKELDMGTDFDDFTEKAFHLSKNVHLKGIGNLIITI